MRTLKIEILYPEFNNLYGDRGNITYLLEKLKKSHCKVEIIQTHLYEQPAFARENDDIDFLYIGPCTEGQQELELKQLIPYTEAIRRRMSSRKITLVTGNAFELLGLDIARENGALIPALGLLNLHAKRFERLRYNDLCVGEITVNKKVYQITGFKNQLSHSYGSVDYPFLKMITGCGINPECKEEGFRNGGFFASYLIGPILPLNPEFSDYILEQMLGTDYVPYYLPFEEMAYACRINDLTKNLKAEKEKKNEKA